MQFDRVQYAHFHADVGKNAQAADTFDELVRLQRMRRLGQDVHLDPTHRRAHQPFDDHGVLVALVLHPERMPRGVDEAGEPLAAVVRTPDQA